MNPSQVFLKSISITTLDTSGFMCPLPVLKARKALKNLKSGECLEVITTDPRAPEDFKRFCVESGHQLKNMKTENTATIMLIQKN